VAPKLCSLVVILLAPGFATAQPDPKKPDPSRLVTRTHNLKPLLANPARPHDLPDADAVVRIILQTIRIGELKAGGDGPQIVVRDGGKLEVRATEKVQDEIKDLIDALGRLADLAVDVKADVIELDKAAFEKLQKVLPRPVKGKADAPAVAFGTPGTEGKAPMAVEKKAVEAANAILKGGRVVQTSTGRYANGAEAVVSARQVVLPQTTRLVAKPAGGADPAFVKEGFRLSAQLVVSGDRRSVRARLTEQSAEVVGVKKRDFGEIGGKPFVATAPEVSEYGRSGTVEVADGGTILFRLDYAPKDKVWVVVLRPTIFIQAEEDVLKEEK
jgi:hypothetical protein